MNNKVYIKNISNHTIIVVDPIIRFRAQLRPMQRYPVKVDDFEILANNEGFIHLVRGKKIQVEDVDAGIDVGLIDVDEVTTDEKGKKVQKNTEDYIGIRNILEKGTDLETKELLNNSTKDRQEMIAQIAIDCKDKISYSKIRLISSITGIDINKALALGE